MTPLVCGLWQQGGVAPAGLAALFEALPGHGTEAEWTSATVLLGCRHPSETANGDAWRSLRADSQSGLAVTASARLDDRDELARALRIPRTRLADLSDADLVLRAYLRWGAACPQRLLGDWAFAVWDAPRRTLFCARDHTGARPFYYASLPGGIAFASEIGAVLAAPGVDGRLDERLVAEWLAGGAAAHAAAGGERTLRRGVRRLLPGHSLTVTTTGERLARWWHPEDIPVHTPASDEKCAEEFVALYRQAVRDCLRGTEGVAGTHLSGGLDSSSVAVLTARELRRQGWPPAPGFAWQPPPPTDRPRSREEALEYGLIDAVCGQEGITPVWCPPTLEDWLAFLRSDVTLGQTTGVVVQELAVQRAAAERGVRVLLSGWGGDEVASYNGRGYYEELLLGGRLVRLWREVRTRSRHPLAHILGFVALPLAAPRVGQALRDLRRRPPRSVRGMAPPKRHFSVRGAQIAMLRHGHLGERAEGWAESGARQGVEYRYPLLDRRLLDFALGLPPEQYRRGPWSRWLMRHALRAVLPPAVCWNRRKADPVRVEAVTRARVEALSEARRTVASRATPPARSRYLDAAGLDDALERAATDSDAMLGNALRLLDF